MQKQNYFAALTLIFGCFFATHSFATTAMSQPDAQSGKSEQGKIISLNSSAMLLPDPCQTVYTGSIGSGDPLQTGRLLRNGIASSCQNLKGSPGLNDATIMRYYDSYSYTNTGNSSICVTVTLSSCGTNLFHAAYLNTFNPAAPTQNYLADPGG